MTGDRGAHPTDPLSSAIISDCGLYRYRLERSWNTPSAPSYGQTTIIMVNPSTADATKNDATIRKLLGFGGGRWANIVVGNLFAYRATDVRELAKVEDPVGPENDEHLRRMIDEAFRLIFAWGPTAKLPRRLRNRWREVDAMARKLGKEPLSIGRPAQDGQPRHPLMLAYSERLTTWLAPCSPTPITGDKTDD